MKVGARALIDDCEVINDNKNCLICKYINGYEDGENLGYEGSHNGFVCECKLGCIKNFNPKVNIKTNCKRFKVKILECRVCKTEFPMKDTYSIYTCGKKECEETLKQWCKDGYSL